MKLGAFSVSLSVKDIHKSKSFYESLGFQVFGGDITQNWLIMKAKGLRVSQLKIQMGIPFL